MERCLNCHPDYNAPGRVIRVNSSTECTACGKKIMASDVGEYGLAAPLPYDRWDVYFHTICVAIASKSPCLSRQIGAILVRDRSIISTGYNGPARGYAHCIYRYDDEGSSVCPRQLKGYKSGEGLHECPAAHAEGNTVINAARNGTSTMGTTLYMNCIIPCKDCAITLVNAGIREIVVDEATPFHEMSIGILESGNIKVREFQL